MDTSPIISRVESTPGEGAPDPRRWITLTVLLVAACMDLLAGIGTEISA